nr:PREDICTED: ganglioside GM2 activator [Tribolium castaneum]|eukprot:XP_973964.2 PREDICTED: ganglioside GM2 activator [Tribolium castaneum]
MGHLNLIFVLLWLQPFLIRTETSYNSMLIKDLKISKCSSRDYPVTVANVTLEMGSKSKIKVTGSLSSTIDLVGPIKASLWIERDIWGVWIPIPCENGLGSCTYNNLCDYGFPVGQTCPEVFIKNSVPCRCPIVKGNYTILPSLDVSVLPTSLLSGTYKGIVKVTQNGLFLSCYNVYFVLYDTLDNEVYSVTQV